MLVYLLVAAALTPYTLLAVLAFHIVRKEDKEAADWVKAGAKISPVVNTEAVVPPAAQTDQLDTPANERAA